MTRARRPAIATVTPRTTAASARGIDHPRRCNRSTGGARAAASRKATKIRTKRYQIWASTHRTRSAIAIRTMVPMGTSTRVVWTCRTSGSVGSSTVRIVSMGGSGVEMADAFQRR